MSVRSDRGHLVKMSAALPRGMATPLLLMAALVAGAIMGHYTPTTGEWLGDRVDATLLTLVGLLIFSVPLNALKRAAPHYRIIALALLTNVAIVPLIGYGIARIFLGQHPLFMIGLMIYFMAPCTDWFLGFTRLSHGNVALGTMLIPLNMTLQLLLYPVFLHWFAHDTTVMDIDMLGETLVHWFLVPLVVAVMAHLALRWLLASGRFGKVLKAADTMTPLVVALLVFQILAGNIATLVAHSGVVVWMLAAVFTFFFMTFWLGEGISRLFHLPHPEHALLTMTIAARNAPLMLAVTMAALPDQPAIYAALVIGMLIEFPHLTLLRQVLLRSHARHPGMR